MLYETRPTITTPGQGVDILLQAEIEAEKLEEQLKKANAYVAELETKILPDIFSDADQVEATAAASGAKAKFGTRIEGSLPKVDDEAPYAERQQQQAKRDRAIEIVLEYDWGPFIKTKVSGSWDKGDREKALRFAEELRKDNSVDMKVDESIHASTLKSQAKKRLEEGKSLDLEALGLTSFPAVKITKRPKSI